jgi:hypothetical protein
MSTSSLSPCHLCTKNISNKILVPMNKTTFLFADKRISVMDSYKTLVDTSKWQKLSSSNPRICRLCLANIIRFYIRNESKAVVCSQCNQQSKNLYTKASIFLVDGRSLALSAVCKLSDNASLCSPCCRKHLNDHKRRTTAQDDEQPMTVSNRRAIVIRKIEDTAPSTSTKTTDKVIALNICLNCFKPMTEDNIVNMRDIRVTVNNQNVDFVDCFQFCTKRVMDSNSLAKPLVCLQCMATIVENYEDQHREVEEIKIEPLETTESGNF